MTTTVLFIWQRSWRFAWRQQYLSKAFCTLIGLFHLECYADNSASFFTPQEQSIIASFGPWPPQPTTDSTNRFSGVKEAINFGKALFFESKLSASQDLSCASCHIPKLHFTDGLAVAQGAERLDRNTPSLMNVGNNRWFGWGGESDSLWSHSVRPLTSPQEMNMSASAIKAYINQTPDYRQHYQALFGGDVSQHDSDRVMINISKALAAYQETLISSRTSFDEFRDALVNQDIVSMKAYPDSAKRGLKLFINQGKCNLCHFGPTFSSKEFADIGIPFFIEGGVDAGRYTGIKTVKSSPYNLLGIYNDSQEKSASISTQHVHLLHKNWGEFKIPSLRGSLYTAPYMHNGSIETLEEVIQHYSEIDEERLHSDGVNILQPLHLSQQESSDLLRFLESLSR